MEIPILYALAQQQNIPVYQFPLPGTGSMSLMDEQGRCFIGMDAGVRDDGPQERVHLGHELGHCVTGSFYNRYAAVDCRQRHENQANKWAIQTLMPVDESSSELSSRCFSAVIVLPSTSNRRSSEKSFCSSNIRLSSVMSCEWK